MEYLLSHLLESSLNHAVLTNDPSEFFRMSNISKFTVYTWEVEKIINSLNFQINHKFQHILSILSQMSNVEGKPDIIDRSASCERFLLPTDESMRINSPSFTSNKLKIRHKVEALIHSNEFPMNSVGKYSPILRLRKILTYKMKKLMKRQLKPVSRRFTGRSSVAKKKLRFRGRFVKKDTIVKRALFKVVHTKAKRRHALKF